jgi:fatty-acyl-CoA synthase
VVRDITLTDPADLDPAVSHLVGPTDSTLLTETIGQNLARTVAAFPDNDALIDLYGDIHLTYQEFHRKVLRLASGLHNAGYRKGDRIGVWSPNRWEWMVLQFATAEIGAILVCINPTYRTRELTYAVNQSGIRALFSAGRFKDSNYRAMIGAVEHTFDRPTARPCSSAPSGGRSSPTVRSSTSTRCASPSTRTTRSTSSTPRGPPGWPRVRP